MAQTWYFRLLCCYITKKLDVHLQEEAIRAKTYGQQQYIHAIKKTVWYFGIGPAGTGKTFVAVVMAVQALGESEENHLNSSSR